MKKWIFAILALLLCLATLTACKQESDAAVMTEAEDLPLQTVDVSAYQFAGNYPALENTLTWEKINNLPQKYPGMTEDEMRKAVVTFYTFSKEFYWISGNEADYWINSGHGDVNLRTGDIYRSFPYVSGGNGNIYRMMDFMDPSVGVVDAEKAFATDALFGNQCSTSTYWAWARVMNSAKYRYTVTTVAANGVVPVGDYTYDFSIERFTASYGTRKIVSDNGQQVMYESYAKIKPGDGLVFNNGSGHAIITTGDTVVVRNADGTIDPAKSYIIYSDQNAPRYSRTTANGDKFVCFGVIDSKKSFQSLYNNSYIPFTYKEFLGEDPVEETEAFCTHMGKTITKAELFNTRVCANYAISDVYAAVYNSLGVEVYKVVGRAKTPSVYQIQLREEPEKEQDNVFVWGSWENIPKNSTVKIYAQLSTGERPILWEGTLVE